MTFRSFHVWRITWRSGASAMLVAGMVTTSACMFGGSARGSIGSPPAELNAENVTFSSASGSQIHAWLVRGQPGAGAVLLLHGVGSNRTSMQGRAQFLHDEGFTVLAPDFQAHGESPGEHVTYGARESLDAAAAMVFLHELAPTERVGVIGVSMGGAASLLGNGPLAANAFVLESVYPTIRQAVSDRLSTWFGPIGGLARMFTSAVIGVAGKMTGVTERELEPIGRIGSIHAPLLLITGTADRYTPLAEAESLYAHAPAPKTFWALDGAGHEDLYDYGRPEYERRVGGFLVKYLR
jgi:pimeloyl-ACP methyl ester carboxylesterase